MEGWFGVKFWSESVGVDDFGGIWPKISWKLRGLGRATPCFYKFYILAGRRLAGSYGAARVEKMAQALTSMALCGKDEGRCSLILVSQFPDYCPNLQQF